jgi:hypothetical protein
VVTQGIAEVLKGCAPGEIRTPDPQVRSLMLYPTELRARKGILAENQRLKLLSVCRPRGLRLGFEVLSVTAQ